MATNRAYAALSGKRTNGYKLEVSDVSPDTDRIALRVVDGSGLSRPPIRMELQGFLHHLSDPRVIDAILEHALAASKRGLLLVQLDYSELRRAARVA
jgi:hypothetical protein